MDYQKFLSLLEKGECEHIDFKIECQAFHNKGEVERGELAKDICALANNRNTKSYIIIGVSDDRRNFHSFSNKNFTDDRLQDFCRKSIFPPPTVRFKLYNWSSAKAPHKGKIFGIIEIGPHSGTAFRLAQNFIDYGNRCCYRRNEVWIRRGAICDFATPEEISGLLRLRPNSTRSGVPNNVVYSRLPVREKSRAILTDIKILIETVGGLWKGNTIIVRTGGCDFIWRVLTVEHLTRQWAIWFNFLAEWNYEHGVIIISRGAVARAALPPDCVVNSKEKWGYYTRLDSFAVHASRRLEIPSPHREFYPVVLTLSNVRDTTSLNRRLMDAFSFMENELGEMAEFKKTRKALNANIRLWLKKRLLTVPEPAQRMFTLINDATERTSKTKKRP